MDSTSDNGGEDDVVSGGSTDESTNISGWSDENSNTLWGWLSGIADNLKTVWETLTDLPTIVWNNFKDGFSTVFGWLSDIFNKIVELPGLILEGIKEIFVPDTDEIDLMFDEAIDSIQSKFGFQEFHLDALANNSSQPTDITEDYTIPGVGTMNFTFFDTTYLIKGVEFFRPFIRGFVVLLLVIYNFKMFLSFIGHDLGATAYAKAQSEKE